MVLYRDFEKCKYGIISRDLLPPAPQPIMISPFTTPLELVPCRPTPPFRLISGLENTPVFISRRTWIDSSRSPTASSRTMTRIGLGAMMPEPWDGAGHS